jgi:Bacterial DNA-binding protein
VGFKEKYKSKKYRQLIEMVAKSSGYYQYEVEDVLNHLVGNIQVLLAEGTPIKISGIGTLKVKKMHVSRLPSGSLEELCYTAYRLSVVSDTQMQSYLKENYVDPTETKSSSDLALPIS